MHRRGLDGEAAQRADVGPELVLEGLESRDQGRIPLLGRVEESVVGRSFLGLLPARFGRIEVGRVGWETEEFNPMLIGTQPCLPFLIEIVAGSIIEDEEDLAATGPHKGLKKDQEGSRLEYIGEQIVEPGA